MSEVETLEVDVLFVGAGPAGLSGALQLSKRAAEKGRALEIAVIDKSAEIGEHGISGAVLDPVALQELVPDYRARKCPIEREIARDEVRYLTRNGSVAIPGFAVPPELHNRGLFTISLGKFVKWLAGEVEERGIYVLPATCAVEVLYDHGRVVGVRTGDKGLGRAGEHKANFEAGTLLKAKVTVFGEGPRGTVSEDLINQRGLRVGREPQIYSLGCKEVIRVAGADHGGIAIHTLGYPLPAHAFGGGFLYELGPGLFSVGMVAGLGWQDPGFDCFEALQNFKKHPLVQRYIRGGEVLSYGAKTIPEGGYFSIPKVYTDGAMLIGDSAGLVDVKRLKGIPQAMTSGMLAADTALEAILDEDYSEASLARYWKRLEASWVIRDLWKRRHFRSAFQGNLYTGLARLFWRELTGGGPKTAIAVTPDHREFRHQREFTRMREPDGYDPSVIIDKLTAVHRSGTLHREDQPSHIKIVDAKQCVERCIPKFGTPPCTHFCPAQVYELVGDGADQKIQVNFSNCVHCKTCGIVDPIDVARDDHIQNIEWRAPSEGGPKYQGL